MSDAIEKFIFLVIGGVGTQILAKFRNRIAILNYSVFHQSLGASVQNPLVGSIEIKYNGHSVESLYLTSIFIENDSSKDIKDIDFNIYCDGNSRIILSQAENESNRSALHLTSDFMKLLEETKTDSTKLEQFLSKRNYKIPALNRQDKVKIFMLVSNTLTQQPIVTVNCEHVGVRMKYAEVHPLFRDEPQRNCAWMGAFVTLLICWPLVNYTNLEFIGIAIIFAGLAGIFSLFFGWALVKWL